jgi:DNA-binding transcriptional LysR family regulator
MGFDVRLLRHAQALADEASFSRAARALHITQPALSRSIGELERRTGFKLFDRGRSGVEPTDLGRVFLAQARGLLASADALEREVAALRGAGTGSLVVGCGTYPSSLFVAPALAAFLGRNAGVAVRLVNDNWASLVSALRRRDLDIIVAALPPDQDAAGLEVRRLSTWRARFLVRAGHPLLARGNLSLSDVVAYPIVSTGRLMPGMISALARARDRHAAGRPLPDVGCESVEVMQRIVSSTDHVMIGAAIAAEGAGLAVLPFTDPAFAGPFAITRLAGRTLPPIADELAADVIAADRAAFESERRIVDALAAPRDAKRQAARRQSFEASAVR